MAILLAATGRPLSSQFLSRSWLAAASRVVHPLSRVALYHSSISPSVLFKFDKTQDFRLKTPSQSYATGAGRPKAHTGRTTGSTRKSTATRKAGTASRTAAKKPKAKPKRKTKAKTKTKTKPKSKKRQLTEKGKERLAKQKANEKVKAAREAALLKPPKKLPDNAWVLVAAEHVKQAGGTQTEKFRAASQRYKNLTPEELERYNHIANQNKAKNDEVYQRWLNSFTPEQIKQANNARLTLRRQAKASNSKKTYRRIKDERLVKQAKSAYIFFMQDRFASGDMKHMKVGEAGSIVSREWKSLSAQEKKKYEDLAGKDRTRYNVEFKTVYGHDPPSRAAAKAKAAAT